MIVETVAMVRIYFKNGHYIDFDSSEIGLQLIQTTVKDSDGRTSTPIEYYQITTAATERPVRNG